MDDSKELMQYSPQGLISQAIAQNLPIETLERLMDLSERWQANQAKSAFLKAMSEFESILPAIKKNRTVKFNQTSYRFTDIGEIAKTIKPALKETGLSYRWELKEEADNIICTCIVSHVNGHSESTSLSGKKDTSGSKNEIQSRGSAVTYLQRYTLKAALGLTDIDEDDDGRGSGNQPEDKKGSVQPPKQLDKTLIIISKITAQTKEADLQRLDSLIMTVDLLDKRKEYLTAYKAQLKKVNSKYEPEVLIK